MEWVAIITMVIEMVQKCRENRSAEEITATALNRPVGRWMIRRHLIDQGIRGRELRDAMSQVRSHEITDDDVKSFVENALDGADV